MKIGRKTAVTKEITRQERNRRNNLKRITISFAVALVVFISLVVIQSSILNQESKHKVYQVIKDISTGTKITEENVNEYLGIKEVQVSLIPEGYITDTNDILNKFVNRDYKAKDILTLDGITDTENLYKARIENPTTLSFSVDSISDAAAGIIREGDYVNIYALRREAFNESELKSQKDNLVLNDDYFTFRHVYITQAYDTSGTEISTSDKESKAQMFTIIISEKDVVKFNEMISNCNIKLSKIEYNSEQTYLDFITNLNIEAASVSSSTSSTQSNQTSGDSRNFWDISLYDVIKDDNNDEFNTTENKQEEVKQEETNKTEEAETEQIQETQITQETIDTTQTEEINNVQTEQNLTEQTLTE